MGCFFPFQAFSALRPRQPEVCIYSASAVIHGATSLLCHKNLSLPSPGSEATTLTDCMSVPRLPQSQKIESL